ncbi:MAG: CcoQ/FixQ family Cbb3-type cytochrome c oxidase assembly chaperone [Ferruginibacter sp.]|nr:CcoQ/FixQ family Cbb3-type cytochrome c oxidase assembly chaperone [Ferruginibacter sp.]
MFKFIKQYAETIDGVGVYPLISLFIFFVFFVAVIYFVKKMKKESVTALSNLPFDDGELKSLNS